MKWDKANNAIYVPVEELSGMIIVPKTHTDKMWLENADWRYYPSSTSSLFIR